MDAQRDEPLLRAVMQVALDPAALGVAGREQPQPRVAQLALEVARPHRDERRLRRRLEQLRLLAERGVGRDRRHGLAGVLDQSEAAAVAGAGVSSVSPPASRNARRAGSQ